MEHIAIYIFELTVRLPCLLFDIDKFLRKVQHLLMEMLLNFLRNLRRDVTYFQEAASLLRIHLIIFFIFRKNAVLSVITIIEAKIIDIYIYANKYKSNCCQCMSGKKHLPKLIGFPWTRKNYIASYGHAPGYV